MCSAKGAADGRVDDGSSLINVDRAGAALLLTVEKLDKLEAKYAFADGSAIKGTFHTSCRDKLGGPLHGDGNLHVTA